MTSQVPELKILVVEDDESVLKGWEDAIKAHNKDAENKGFFIHMVTSKSVTDAKQKLDLYRLDAVVVDLRLQTEDGFTENNSHGNDLVRHILEVQPLGVVVFTGQGREADRYGCRQVEVMDKADGMAQVFDWLGENKEVFLRLRGAKSAFNRETARVFFRSIWPRWCHWTSSKVKGADLTEVVARHVVAHVHDSMLNAGGDATHPEEAYFVPPLRDRLDTGDLVQNDEGIWIVVTPRCDLANPGKVNTILLALCTDISKEWCELTRVDAGKSKKEKMKRLVQHDGSPKQHFLHPMQDANGQARGPWLVQFHHLKAIAVEQALKELTPLRFASLSPLFIPSLVERFGAYFSRIGTPDYSSD